MSSNLATPTTALSMPKACHLLHQERPLSHRERCEMATINKRPSGKWQATVRRAGRSASKTFTKRADALKWARDAETEAERSGIVGRPAMAGVDAVPACTLADALHQLANEQAGERWRLHALARTRMAKLRIDVLTADDIVQWRDLRMRDARPSTVVRELSLMQTEPPLVCRRPRSKDPGSWERQRTEHVIQKNCARERCGWSWITRTNMRADRRQSCRSLKRLDAAGTACASGLSSMRRIPASATV